MKTKKKPSGGGRIKAAGRSLIWVTADESQKKKIRTAAAQEGVPMSEFLLNQGLSAAEKILEKMFKTT